MAGFATDRAVWRIAAPLILSNLTTPLLGMVDSGVMGHLDRSSYMGAVAVGAVIFNFLYLGLNFLRMGTTGMAAQAHGSSEAGKIRTVLARGMVVAMALALLLFAFQVPIGRLAVWLLDGSAEVKALATNYYSVRIFSAPATLANMVLVGWFIGMQRASGALWITLTTNVLNMVLDLFFVLGLGLDVEGVALASVIAEYSALGLGLFLVARELKLWPGRFSRSAILEGSGFRQMLAINGNILIRTLSLMFAIAYLTRAGARQGDVILAANAILIHLQHITAYGLDGFANAAEALVGKAYGAKDRVGLREAFRVSLRWSLWVGVLFTLAYVVGGRAIVNLVTDLPDVRATTYIFLPWMIASPLISVWSFLLDGVFVGLTWARQMRNSMLVSTFLVFLPAWWLLEGWGNHGLWLAFMVFMLARAVTMGIYLLHSRVLTPQPGIPA